MIEINDIKKAVEEKLPLFQNGSVISYDACEYLLEQSYKDTEVLFSSFPMIRGYNRSYIYIMCLCPNCRKKYSFKATKTNIKDSKKRGMIHLSRHCSSIDYDVKRAMEKYIDIIKPENDLRGIPQICDDCLLEFYNQLKSEYNGFYKNPLKWVNTHSKDMDAWAWKRISKAFTYPPGYDDKPDGWKYCGLRMLTEDSKGLKEIVDANFNKWKTNQNKIRPAMNVSSVHIGLKEIFGDKLYSNTADIARKKTIRLIEDAIEGLLENTNTDSLLRHINSECTHILKNFEKFSNSSHILGFGKYKGYTVHDVIERDPDYICWALDNIDSFTLDENEWAHYIGKPWKMDSGNSEIYNDEESSSEEIDEDKGTIDANTTFGAEKQNEE